MGKAIQPLVINQIKVPQALLTDCYIPEASLTNESTNEDLEIWIDALYNSLLECSESKKSLREFLEVIYLDINKEGR